MNTSIRFPSGRSIDRCKQDAKKLVRQSKANGQNIFLAQALDVIARENGLDLPWAKAIQQLQSTIISKPKSPREARKHLLGHALNELLARGLVTLDPADDVSESYVECNLCGKPSLINWEGISHDEVRISIWWNYDKTSHPQHQEGGYKGRMIPCGMSYHQFIEEHPNVKNPVHANSNAVDDCRGSLPLAGRKKFHLFLGAACSAWVERRTSKHLQLSERHDAFDNYLRKTDRESFAAIPDCQPNGFKLEGQFFL